MRVIYRWRLLGFRIPGWQPYEAITRAPQTSQAPMRQERKRNGNKSGIAPPELERMVEVLVFGPQDGEMLGREGGPLRALVQPAP